MPKFTDDIKLENGKYPSFAFPGGYPLYYLCKDCGVLCPDCVNKEISLISEQLQLEKENQLTDHQWHVTHYDINYEDPSLICDHCNKRIPSAYAEND